MKINVLNTRTAMGQAAGRAVEEKILELLSEKEEISMIFAAAPSQNEFFAYLRQSSLIPWQRITAFHMDEYIGLPKDEEALFANFLKRNIFDQVNFKEVHLIDGNKDPEEERLRYSSLLDAQPIDIVCLGIGENGHIAFNDPPVADFEDPETVKKVELDLACKQQQVNDGCFPTLADVPREALTLTIPTLMRAAHLFCIVPGRFKRQAVYRSIHGPITTACPASILQTHSDCELFVDTAAYPVDSADPAVLKISAKNCLTGQPVCIEAEQSIKAATAIPAEVTELPYIGPGLIDLQINGINGIDFNDTSLTVEDLTDATQYLLSQGVTGYLPTLITNSDENILKILSTISAACEENPLVDSCILGIHLEGPFLSDVDGARGAHDRQYIKPPSWELVQRFQEAAGGKIRLITMAPEWDGSPEFIRKCREEGIFVSIGHTNANADQIDAGVRAGATLSTHLGNAVPLMLPRHPNLLWEQLSKDDLSISIIADGFHLPDSFLKVALKVKENQVLLVSDATCFSGMEPGEYNTHIGDQVVLSKEGRLSLKNSNGLLAGATKSLLENIQYLISRNLATLGKAWEMGSIGPLAFLGLESDPLGAGNAADFVVFDLSENNEIRIEQVIKGGKVVFSH